MKQLCPPYQKSTLIFLENCFQIFLQPFVTIALPFLKKVLHMVLQTLRHPYLEFSPKTCRYPKICSTGLERGCKPVLCSVLFILSVYDKALKIYKSDQSKKKT